MTKLFSFEESETYKELVLETGYRAQGLSSLRFKPSAEEQEHFFFKCFFYYSL